jgi:hypothetical protein
MGWITVITALASCHRLSDETNVLQLVSVIQGYVIVAFVFSVLATAPKFGPHPECNHEAVAVILRPFSALKGGRIFGWCIVGLMSLGYTIMTARDYTAQIQRQIRKRRRSEKELGETPAADAQEPARTPIFIPTPAPFVPANTTATQQRQVSARV